MITYSSIGISLDKPIVTSCGTGVTACILALVSETLCFSLSYDPSLYDDNVWRREDFETLFIFVGPPSTWKDWCSSLWWFVDRMGRASRCTSLYIWSIDSTCFEQVLLHMTLQGLLCLFNFLVVKMTAGVVSWNNETIWYSKLVMTHKYVQSLIGREAKFEGLETSWQWIVILSGLICNIVMLGTWDLILRERDSGILASLEVLFPNYYWSSCWIWWGVEFFWSIISNKHVHTSTTTITEWRVKGLSIFFSRPHWILFLFHIFGIQHLWAQFVTCICCANEYNDFWI